ncbi:sigma-70 family RNA polymerase sigma factor [Promicromonospora kroppenstedtii]|uniref:sigma-70 family RNA polymerase sigma factor n=1 Tax=Promicromonospora kroppenstedtii TaxID=440482 RepID=UPI00055D0976|nr:sigma-70 family RNA polymerase sigma factor [Promicromonospora kroppenstedtii]
MTDPRASATPSAGTDRPGSRDTEQLAPPRSGASFLDDAALERLRPLSFTVAYRMLGSVAEAEDVVQEALTRVAQAPDVRNPDAFITTVTTRIAIDVLRSARVRRESYVGEWLPEPLVGAVPYLPVAMGTPAPDVARHAELADDLSTAFLVLLETLTPTERAAFLLHDVLGFPHSEAAGVIGTSEVAARQLASRARRRIAATAPARVPALAEAQTQARTRAQAPTETPARTQSSSLRSTPDRARAEQLVSRFLAACEEGAVDSFLELLTEDVVLTGDGGGNVPQGMSIVRPVAGRVTVARMLASFISRGAPVHFERALVGGEPGLLIVADDVVGGGLIGTWSFEVTDGRLSGIRGVINPRKLGHLGPLADLDRVQAALRHALEERTAARRAAAHRAAETEDPENQTSED